MQSSFLSVKFKIYIRTLAIAATATLMAFASSAQISLNVYVDTLEPEVKNALTFFKLYVQEFREGNMPDFSKYWNAKDCEEYKYPDQIIYAIASDYPTYRMGKAPSILYIKPDSTYVHIKTLFARADSSGIYTFAITNHYIESVNGHLYFVSPLKINAKDWQKTTIRNVTWYYPAYHEFDTRRADSLIAGITALERTWGLGPINVRYYFADTKDEIKKIRGFDYTVDMGNREKPSGISNDEDNIVYCHGLGENYFHEVVHIYLNRLFPKSPLQEGLAVFYGGTLGHSLEWHLARIDDYLKTHPDLDLGDWDELHAFYLDNYTNTASAIKGLLCKLAYDKAGITGLRRLMRYTSVDDIYAMEFHVKPDKRNEFLRRKIAANKLTINH
jgi:hypothetical protein